MLHIKKITEIKDVFKLYRYVQAHYPSTALLESLGNYDKDVSHYSIMGIIAEKQLFEKDDNFYIKSFESNSIDVTENWLETVDEWCGSLGKSSTPFQTGAIGYIGYEMHRCFEFVPNSEKFKSPMPKICLTKYSLIYVYDRENSSAYWVSDKNMDNEIEKIEKAFYSYVPANDTFYTFGDTEKDFTPENYLESIRKCIHHIEIGDMLQANITMRFHGNFMGNPIILYEALRNSTPNPFFAYFDFEHPLISTSPESFLHIADNTITSRPIKGTVRTEIDGNDQITFLEQNAKNCSENVMITDLIRNDIGRVSQIGTVDVPVLCGTKKFNQIYHLETVVNGTLKDDIKLSDILKSNFPGGSITGAPKVKAMEIIDNLEFAERGPYCGALGFFGSEGFVSTSIGIRLIYFCDNTYYLHAGGGIVVKSDPQDEYEALLLKVESLINTLNRFDILASYREELNIINADLLRIISRRVEVVKQISKIKQDHKIPIIQEDRMKKILASAYKQNADEELNIPETLIEGLLKVIFDESMKLEEIAH